MRKLSQSRIIIITVFFLLTMGVTFEVMAQNFADYTPADKNFEKFDALPQSGQKEDQDTSSDEEIDYKKILEDAGIPLTANAYGKSDESLYTLGTTDVIQISVMRHPEVSGQFVINMEGKIQYEFVGDIEVAGLTKEEVKNLLTERLSEYVIAPEVNVKIVGYNSKVVYVIGEVGNPGKIYMRGDTISVREALVQAGLPLLSAKTTKSSVITPTDDGYPGVKPVDIHKLLIKGDLRENLVMTPGDTLYIPPTIMARTMRVIQPIAAPITTGSGAARTVTTGF